MALNVLMVYVCGCDTSTVWAIDQSGYFFLQEEKRLRTTVMAAEPIDRVAYNKHIVEQMKKYV